MFKKLCTPRDIIFTLYVDVIKEHHAWYVTNWETYMRFIGVVGGIYSYDMSMKMWCTYFKTPCMKCNQMTQWNAYLPYSYEMWCMIKKWYAWHTIEIMRCMIVPWWALIHMQNDVWLQEEVKSKGRNCLPFVP